MVSLFFKKKVLLIEPNFCHDEVLPGIANYFLDLGYSVDVLANEKVVSDDPFCNMKDKNLHIFSVSAKTMFDEVKRCAYLYDVLYFNSEYSYTQLKKDPNEISIYEPILNIYQDALNGYKGKILVMYHHYNALKEKTSVQHIRLSLFPHANGFGWVNAHYFGSFPRHKKNKITNFVCVGMIDEKRKNHASILNAVENLLKEGIGNFFVTIIAKKGEFEIPTQLKTHVSFIGITEFCQIFECVKKADFLLFENDIEVKYKQSQKEIFLQFCYGFLKPIVFGGSWLDSKIALEGVNAVCCEDNGMCENAMKKAINMTNEEYNKNVSLIKQVADRTYIYSLFNLKHILNDKTKGLFTKITNM